MATDISAVATAVPYRFNYPRRRFCPSVGIIPGVGSSNCYTWRCFAKQRSRKLLLGVKDENGGEKNGVEIDDEGWKKKLTVEEKMVRKKSERDAYLIAALVSSFGITSMAAIAVYYRFSWQMEVFFFLSFSSFLFFWEQERLNLWHSNYAYNFYVSWAMPTLT